MTPELLTIIIKVSIFSMIALYTVLLLLDFTVGLKTTRWRVIQHDNGKWRIQCGNHISPFWDDFCNGELIDDTLRIFEYDTQIEATEVMLQFENKER